MPPHDTSGQGTPISIELEAALARALLAAWHDLNASRFRRALAPPVVNLIDGRSRLGQWRSQTRELAISRALVVEQPWGIVVEILKHEMAHQFVDEVMGVKDETAHGPTFSDLCERLGIDATACGMPAPGVGAGASDETVRRLSRVAKLLALAESPERHEAEAAMAAAQRLMLKYNLDARAGSSSGLPNGYGFRHLGRATGRTGEAERTIACLLEEHFFVEVIWVPVWRAREGRRGSVLEICGTPENLEMASYVYEFLTRSSDSLWRSYKKERGLDGDRERRAFIAGVMSGFQEKLARARVETRKEGLVWIRDADLHTFYRRRHPHIRMTRHLTSRGSGSHSDGKAAGRELVLHKPVTSGGGRRLLLR